MMRSIMFRGLQAADIAMIMAAFGLSSMLSITPGKWTNIGTVLASKVSLSSCALLAIAILLCHGIFSLCRLYESKRLSTKHDEAVDVLRAMGLSTACLWFEGRLFSISLMTAYFLLAFFVTGSIFIIVMRLLLRYALGSIRKRGRNLHHVLVLGTNSRAIAFGRRIEAMPDRGYRLLGFVDDHWPGLEEFKATGLPLASSYQSLPEFLRHNVVDEVAIYLPLRSFYQRAEEMAKLAEHHGILLRFDSEIFDLKVVRRRAELTSRESDILAGSGLDDWQLLVKRLLDIIGSVLLLALLSPLFAVVAVLIKMTSPGPVLFRQKRVGLNKRQFTMYKFRTMFSGAENFQEKLLHLNEMSGPVFKIKNDPRVTRVGRILRKTSIDELPQLFNVLRGDMSLVGPRAMSVRDYQFFSEDWQRRRFSVPPGITCLWQIHGRNAVPFDQWMVLDMQYIDRWSLWLDLKILALTIPAVFRGSGAV